MGFFLLGPCCESMVNNGDRLIITDSMFSSIFCFNKGLPEGTSVIVARLCSKI